MEKIIMDVKKVMAAAKTTVKVGKKAASYMGKKIREDYEYRNSFIPETKIKVASANDKVVSMLNYPNDPKMYRGKLCTIYSSKNYQYTFEASPAFTLPTFPMSPAMATLDDFNDSETSTVRTYDAKNFRSPCQHTDDILFLLNKVQEKCDNYVEQMMIGIKTFHPNKTLSVMFSDKNDLCSYLREYMNIVQEFPQKFQSVYCGAEESKLLRSLINNDSSLDFSYDIVSYIKELYENVESGILYKYGEWFTGITGKGIIDIAQYPEKKHDAISQMSKIVYDYFKKYCNLSNDICNSLYKYICQNEVD